jgi:hypothetical protein
MRKCTLTVSHPLKQVSPAVLLTVGRILNLDPIPCVGTVLIGAVGPFRDNAFEV